MSVVVAESQFLESGPVARELGIAVETLRQMERMGAIPAPRRTANGRRLFTREEVEVIRRVREDRKCENERRRPK